MEVLLRDRERRVTERRLEILKWHPLAEVARIGMAELVRPDVAVNAGPGRDALHHPANGTPMQRRTHGRPTDHAEQRMAPGQPELLAPVGQPAVDFGARHGIERDHATLATLPAQHGHPAVDQVDVLRVKREHLGAAQARAPHHHDHGAVAPAGMAPAAGSQHRVHLFGGRRIGRELSPLVMRRLPLAVARLRDGRTVEAAAVELRLHRGFAASGIEEQGLASSLAVFEQLRPPTRPRGSLVNRASSLQIERSGRSYTAVGQSSIRARGRGPANTINQCGPAALLAPRPVAARGLNTRRTIEVNRRSRP